MVDGPDLLLARCAGWGHGAVTRAPRILIHDSDEVTRRCLASLLTRHGFEVDAAENSRRLLEQAAAAPPDLILTELTAVDANGARLLPRLRSNNQLERVPIIVLSLRDSEDDIVQSFEDGALDYVVKPFHARELVARLRLRLGASPTGGGPLRRR